MIKPRNLEDLKLEAARLGSYVTDEQINAMPTDEIDQLIASMRASATAPLPDSGQAPTDIQNRWELVNLAMEIKQNETFTGVLDEAFATVMRIQLHNMQQAMRVVLDMQDLRHGVRDEEIAAYLLTKTTDQPLPDIHPANLTPDQNHHLLTAEQSTLQHLIDLDAWYSALHPDHRLFWSLQVGVQEVRP